MLVIQSDLQINSGSQHHLVMCHYLHAFLDQFCSLCKPVMSHCCLCFEQSFLR